MAYAQINSSNKTSYLQETLADARATHIGSLFLDDADLRLQPSFSAPSDQVPPVILSLPHGGRYFPRSAEPFLCDIAESQTLEDTGTFEICQHLGPVHQLLIQPVSRAIIDVNRPEDTLDPMITGAHRTARKDYWQRFIDAGYGVVPRLSASRKQLFNTTLPPALIESWLSSYHASFHQMLTTKLLKAASQHSRVLLLDIHSMPDDNTARQLPDIVFGNMHQASCRSDITLRLGKMADEAGLSYDWNRPYAGGYITRHYARLPIEDDRSPKAAAQIEVVQIEFNRRLYQTRAGRSEALDSAALMRLGQWLDRTATHLNSYLG